MFLILKFNAIIYKNIYVYFEFLYLENLLSLNVFKRQIMFFETTRKLFNTFKI